jgi:2-polyprenyl-3-methyl-5-hydroxy-6-metoxy-1,4-benzoquinol methylase
MTLNELLSSYPSLTFFQRAHMTIRWVVCPLRRIAACVPQRGVILDLGCGHGLFALLLARTTPTRAVIGIDLDQDKIKLANTLQHRNLRFIAGDVAKQEDLPPAQAVTIVDVFYLVPYEAQESLLQLCAQRLATGGVIVLKEMAEAPRWKVWLNWLEETLAVRVLRITESTDTRFYFRPRADWVALFEKLGFTVEIVPLDKGYYHPHVVFIATLASH